MLLVLPLESSKEENKARPKLRGNGGGNNELVKRASGTATARGCCCSVHGVVVPRAGGCWTKPLTDAMAAAMEVRLMRLGPILYERRNEFERDGYVSCWASWEIFVC